MNIINISLVIACSGHLFNKWHNCFLTAHHLYLFRRIFIFIILLLFSDPMLNKSIRILLFIGYSLILNPCFYHWWFFCCCFCLFFVYTAVAPWKQSYPWEIQTSSQVWSWKWGSGVIIITQDLLWKGRQNTFPFYELVSIRFVWMLWSSLVCRELVSENTWILYYPNCLWKCSEWLKPSPVWQVSAFTAQISFYWWK